MFEPLSFELFKFRLLLSAHFVIESWSSARINCLISKKHLDAADPRDSMLRYGSFVSVIFFICIGLIFTLVSVVVSIKNLQFIVNIKATLAYLNDSRWRSCSASSTRSRTRSKPSREFTDWSSGIQFQVNDIQFWSTVTLLRSYNSLQLEYTWKCNLWICKNNHQV